jgi:ATP synthase protein I
MATDRRPSDGAAVRAVGPAAAFGAMLRGSASATLAVAAVAVVVAALLAGAKGAWSSALGAGLVIVFFSLSLLVMQRTASWQPTAVMSTVLATYTAKIIALGVAMVLLRDASWLSGRALALTVIVCTVVWLAFEMRAFTRMRILVTSQAPPPADEGRAGAASDGGEDP